MKLLVIFLLISSFAVAQTPDSKPDTSKMEKIVVPPDSIALISLRDFNTFFSFLQESVSKANYDKLTPDKVLGEFAQWMIIRYNEKKKKK